MKTVANARFITLWLLLTMLLVLAMISLGGFTRLSESGLSITEWKPVTGTLPPLSIESWQEEFSKYKQTPEFIQKNQNISFKEFKFIYMTEYLHRLLGRATVLCFALPLFYLIITKQILAKHRKKFLNILLLFLAQGLIGWVMVKSGLSKQPYVSHFKLGFHLNLAVLIFGLLLWNMLNIKRYSFVEISNLNQLQFLRRLGAICLILLFIQIYVGALVAGLDAGLIYNSFPSMNGSFLPDEIHSVSLKQSFSNAGMVQFYHRILAYVTIIAIIYLIYKSCTIIQDRAVKFSSYLIIVLLIAQVSLGILTLLQQVPMNIALLHQLVAPLLLGSVIILYNYIYRTYYYNKSIFDNNPSN